MKRLLFAAALAAIKIQESYGIGKDEAERQIKDFEEHTKQ